MDFLPVTESHHQTVFPYSTENLTEVVSKRSNRTFLPFWTCFFVNTPENGAFPVTESGIVYTCKLKIQYVAGNECDLFGTQLPCGYWICAAITAVIVLLANFGVFSNLLNLIILPKSLKGCSVKRLMMLLAFFDLLASICAIPLSLLMLFILGRFENRYGAFASFQYLHLLFSLGRTGSIFITIVITIERYIAVGFPLKQWMTSKKSRIHLMIVIPVIILLNLPWWLNKQLLENETYFNSAEIPAENDFSQGDLRAFPYIFKGTAFARNVYPHIVRLHLFVDFALPFPLLLIFNGLLYRSIHLANKARQTLTISQRREINAAKMFCTVALILLFCHTLAVVLFVLTQVRRETFRELQFCQMLSITLNASINFMIYYIFGNSFRNEFWSLLGQCKLFRGKIVASPQTSSDATVEVGGTGGTRSTKLKRIDGDANNPNQTS